MSLYDSFLLHESHRVKYSVRRFSRRTERKNFRECSRDNILVAVHALLMIDSRTKTNSTMKMKSTFWWKESPSFLLIFLLILFCPHLSCESLIPCVILVSLQAFRSQSKRPWQMKSDTCCWTTLCSVHKVQRNGVKASFIIHSVYSWVCKMEP